jgi:type IV pilus assembly protein PilB
VAAQRLVKKICTYCKTPYNADEDDKIMLDTKNDTVLFRGRGCPRCYNTGYRGRIAVHEIMKVDDNVKNAIYSGNTADELTLAAYKSGMKSLRDNCRQLVLQGITTIDEYRSVLYKL